MKDNIEEYLKESERNYKVVRKAVNYILKRDNYICYICKQGENKKNGSLGAWPLLNIPKVKTKKEYLKYVVCAHLRCGYKYLNNIKTNDK